MRGEPLSTASEGAATAGVELSSQRFPLRAFQKKFVRKVEGGRYDRLALSTPRGNGKSWLAAHILARSLTPGDPLFAPATESVLASSSLEQCRVVFRFVRAMLGEGGYRYQDSSTRLGVTHTETNTRLRAVGSSGRTIMGIGAGTAFVVADEPGSWENAGGTLMADAIDTALGKPNSRMCAIYIGTRWPSFGGWWIDLLDRGTVGKTYVQTIQADPKLWDSWKEIRRCNPLAAVSRKFSRKLKEELSAALENSGKKAKFHSTRLNIPMADPENQLIDWDHWQEALQRPVPPRVGNPIVAIDIGANRAWTASVAIWRNGRTEAVAIAPGVPSIEEQELRDKVPRGVYAKLVEAGRLEIEPGKKVPTLEHLAAIVSAWEPAVCFGDRFGLMAFADVVNGEYEVVPRVTRYAESSADIAALRRFVADGPIAVEQSSAAP